mmetsp:Transcript_10757/g.22750  ORF Transcript_10757/g.22750 Transcript_10757/m.22750 type:complete len:353 (+) Transcript_10757:835-1893(+)
MAVLQATAFMIYQLQIMALFAYYPEIARESGQKRMNSYLTTWSMWQFVSQAGVNCIILLCSVLLRLNKVRTAMYGQGITFLFCVVYLMWCWYLMPARPPTHILPKGNALLLAGFRQNYSTLKKIWKHYPLGLRWFLLCTTFAESAATAVGTTAVIFLTVNLKLTALQIGIFFEVSLVGVVFGTKVGMVFTQKTNPKFSYLISQIGLGLVVAIGAWAVQGVEVKELTYMWGFSIGTFLGWYYPVENLIYSMLSPPGQETELSGFFGYCSQIMGWFPPLCFTLMVEASVNMAWALTVVASIFILSVGFLLCAGTWDEMLEELNTVEVKLFENLADPAAGDNAADSGEATKNDQC